MLRKLILLLLPAVFPLFAAAQQDTKSTQNSASPNIDYKREGSPLPIFYMREYHDSTAANAPELTKKEKKRRAKGTQPVSNELYTTLTNADVDNGANLIIMLFNPTCSHCEEMTSLMEQHIKMFRKTKILLIASKPMAPYLPDFAERHHIAKYPAMHIGYDSANFIDNIFTYQKLPQFTIYDGNRKLLKIFTGEVPVDTLRKFAE